MNSHLLCLNTRICLKVKVFLSSRIYALSTYVYESALNDNASLKRWTVQGLRQN